MRFHFGPVVLEVGGLDCELEDAWSRDFAGFLTEAEADAIVRVTVDPALRAAPKPLRPELSYDVDGRRANLRGSAWQAAFRFDDGQVELLTGGVWPGIVRVILSPVAQAFALHSGSGIGFHGSTVVHQDQATLFVGKSGAGKSTVARLCAEAGLDVLAEELSFVGMRDPDEVACHMLPFLEKDALTVPRVRAVPLREVLVLEQAAHDRVEALDADEQFTALMRCASIGLRVPHLARQAVSVLGSLRLTVPIRRLRFAKTPALTEFLVEHWRETDTIVAGNGLFGGM